MKMYIILLTAGMYLTACGSDAANSNANADTSLRDTAAAVSQTSTTQDTSGNGLMKAMSDMMSRMHTMQMSGGFDKDWASMLIEHHQGAIDMAKVEVLQGADEKLKAKAHEIITKQTDEQNKLRDMINNLKPASMKMGEGELQKSMDAMMNKMQTMQMTGDVDKDFAMLMISHHEDGIAMSKIELKNGMNSQLKQMAQKGINDQQKDIKEFKGWMAAHK